MSQVLFTLLLGLLVPPIGLAVLSVTNIRVPYRIVKGWVQLGSIWLLAGAVTLDVLFCFFGTGVPVMFSLPPVLRVHGYVWQVELMLDPLALTYLSLVAIIYPAVVRFSTRQFYREPGAIRYFFLMTVLAFALSLISVSGNIDVLFTGWELVGVCSVMLIAFFRTNQRAVLASLRALVFYRLCDMGILGAAVWMHHAFPDSSFLHLSSDTAIVSAPIVAVLLLFGSLAKSAQFPMTSWMPRAMEGPASSSAIFYGALSIHLGPFLLLRTAPLWEPFVGVRWVMASVGLLTATYTAFIGLTRRDAKTTLGYATAGQLGVIYIELAFGLTTLALIHMVLHASLRAWQFLRASSLIVDFQDNPAVQQAVLSGRSSRWENWFAPSLGRALYFASLREFWFESALRAFVVRPFLSIFEAAQKFEDLLNKSKFPSNFRSAGHPVLALVQIVLAGLMWASTASPFFNYAFLSYLVVAFFRTPNPSQQTDQRPSRASWSSLIQIAMLMTSLWCTPQSAPGLFAIVSATLCASLMWPFHAWISLPTEQRRYSWITLAAQPGLAWLHHQVGHNQLIESLAQVPTARMLIHGGLVLSAILHVGVGLVETNPSSRLYRLFLSQSCFAGAALLFGSGGWHATRFMAFSIAASSAILLSVAITAKRSNSGAYSSAASSSAMWFGVTGWLAVGVPGGAAFFAEDLLFHLFAEHSVFAIAGFILATGLGAIVFYQSYVVLYCGPAQHEPNVDRSRGWGQRVLLAALLIVFSMGFAPQLWSGD